MGTTPTITSSVIRRIANELWPPKNLPWLRRGDRIDWEVFRDDAGDCLFIRGVLTYAQWWRDLRYAEVEIPNRVLRQLSLIGNKSLMVEVVERASKDVIELLREPAPRLFPELCSQATQDDGALDVLVDALLEAGAITQTVPLPKSREEGWQRMRDIARRHAFMTMAELICGEWQETPWSGWEWPKYRDYLMDNAAYFRLSDNAAIRFRRS